MSPASTVLVQRHLRLWMVPLALCLALYYHGLLASYQMDDFVWLGQVQRVHSFSDFFDALFRPAAHGTWRPISERLPFLLFGYLFQDFALPFRLLVFLTVIADCALLSALVLRLTASRLAAFAAPLLWLVNSSLGFPMAWSCAYMQFLCGFCLLLALHLFLRFVGTGRWRYYWLQVAVFVLGFGVMETTVVYPALATAYALLFARKHVRYAAPLFLLSFAFVAFHMWYAPKVAAGPYSMHIGVGMLATFGTYWSWVLSPPDLLALFPAWPTWLPALVVFTETAALAAFVSYSTWRRQFAPLFLLVSFGILLGPVLPLRDHLQLYYLTLPAMAFAGLMAAGLRWGWGWGRLGKGAAIVLVGLYCLVQAPAAHRINDWWYERSQRIRVVTDAVKQIRENAPRKTILLTGVNEEIFTGAVRDRAFEALGIHEVYLSAANAEALPAGAGATPGEFVLDPAHVRTLLETGGLAVLSLSHQPPQDRTAEYRKAVEKSPRMAPATIDTGEPVAAPWLGPSWYPAESGYRWMPQRATLQLRGPKTAPGVLEIRGYCAPELVTEGPQVLTVRAGGETLGTVELPGAGLFDKSLPLPSSLAGQPGIEIELEVSRTFRPPTDPRELGLVISRVAIR